MSVKELQKAIEKTVDKVNNEPKKCREELEEMGYAEYFPKGKVVGSDHVLNVLFHMEDVTRLRKFKLPKDDLDSIKVGMCKLLKIENVDSFLETENLRALRRAKSPLDLADKLKNDLTVDRKIKLIEKLIQHQFEIAWNTKSGDPKHFTYSEFCAKAGSRELLQYSPRNRPS